MFKKILVGYDGSKGAKIALKRAVALAKENRAKLYALWVCEPLPRYSDLPGEPEEEFEASEKFSRARRAEIAALAKKSRVSISYGMRRGHPAKALVDYADETGCDLIVVGHSAHSALWGRLLGDIADRIADHARCSVLLVKD